MEITTETRRIPSEETVREAAKKIFEDEAGLEIDNGSWQYRMMPDRDIAVARFALCDGANTVFRRVLIMVRYSAENTCKIDVQASINRFPPTRREFYVAEECLLPAV